MKASNASSIEYAIFSWMEASGFFGTSKKATGVLRYLVPFAMVAASRLLSPHINLTIAKSLVAMCPDASRNCANCGSAQRQGDSSCAFLEIVAELSTGKKARSPYFQAVRGLPIMPQMCGGTRDIATSEWRILFMDKSSMHSAVNPLMTKDREDLEMRLRDRRMA